MNYIYNIISKLNEEISKTNITDFLIGEMRKGILPNSSKQNGDVCSVM